MKNLLQLVRLFYAGIKAGVSRRLVVRQVRKVLKVTHAQELAAAPRNEWPLMMRQHQKEIQAVADGRIDIVDRRTWSFPYLPESLHRLNQPVLKNTPYNIRRFSETPIPRRAINLIKNAVLDLDWQVVAIETEEDETPERELRIRVATECLKRPNNEDSFRDLFEAVLEDFIIGGYGCIEPALTPWYRRPFKMWAVDGSTVRRFLDWSESTPNRPKYAQMTGLKGERGIITFLAHELIYIRDNIRTSTPFGLGKLEVAFNTVNAFLGAQEMGARAGSDQVHKTLLWWEQTLNPSVIQTVRRYLMNEAEGQSKISMVAGAKKPEVVDIQAVNSQDLLLDWQEFLIRIIANAFDLSPLALGLERDVNRNTGEIMADADFRAAVVPTAKRLEEAVTRHLFHGYLGWKDIEFKFIGLEDPDAMTETQIQQSKYGMDSITPDEIREKDGLPPLAGGWGKLTRTQSLILMQKATAEAKGAAGGGPPGGPGGMPGGPAGDAVASRVGQGGPTSMMAYSAQEVMQMSAPEVSLYQQLGLLPPVPQLKQEMEKQEPGILEKLSDELKQFFEKQEELMKQTQTQPARITPEMEEEQKKKFEHGQHKETAIEQAMNRRGVFGPAVTQQDRKNPVRGKYPTGRYQPGKGNTRI